MPETLEIDLDDPAAVAALVDKLQALLPPARPAQPKVWAIAVNGQTIRVEDFLLADLITVSQRTDVILEFIVSNPTFHGNVALELLELAARQSGLETLPPVTFKAMKGYFVEVDDDLPFDDLPDEDHEPDPTSGGAASTAG